MFWFYFHEIFQIDPQNYETDKILQELRSERGYSYEDEIECSQECLDNYEKKVLHLYNYYFFLTFFQ